MGDLEKDTLTVKSVAVIVSAVIMWVGSLCAVYFPMDANVKKANSTAESCKVRLDNFNPDIVLYRLNELDKNVKANNDKADRIIDMLTHPK
jgi:archaellum component FlaF (FlaF/FlaG flagellin family)